jgi:hypothetical protein
MILKELASSDCRSYLVALFYYVSFFSFMFQKMNTDYRILSSFNELNTIALTLQCSLQ